MSRRRSSPSAGKATSCPQLLLLLLISSCLALVDAAVAARKREKESSDGHVLLKSSCGIRFFYIGKAGSGLGRLEAAIGSGREEADNDANRVFSLEGGQ